jgi:hypothetical protein
MNTIEAFRVIANRYAEKLSEEGGFPYFMDWPEHISYSDIAVYTYRAWVYLFKDESLVEKARSLTLSEDEHYEGIRLNLAYKGFINPVALDEEEIRTLIDLLGGLEAWKTITKLSKGQYKDWTEEVQTQRGVGSRGWYDA